MKKLNYQAELKQIMQAKRLVEIYFHGASSFGVSYILDTNEDYITLGMVGNNDVYMGIGIFSQSDVESIAIDTTYLKLTEKLLADGSLYEKSLNDVKDFENFSIEGFISELEKSGAFAELHLDDERMFVKFISHNEDVLVVDEYSDSRKGVIAHTFYKLSDVARIAIKTPSLKMVEMAQFE